MAVEVPPMDDVDEVVDLWVALARDQRAHRSHLQGEANRSTIRESIAQHVVTEGMLVTRAGDRRRTDRASDETENDGDDGGDALEDDPTVGDNEAVPREADDPDRIVGFVMFGPETGSFHLDVTRGVVENIYVLPAYRGEGRGSELLEAAETRLFEAGFDRVSLDVMAANDAARRFYERHGYDPHRLELEKGPENDTHSKGE